MTGSEKASILLVDDDSAVLGTTKRVLSHAGCLVDSTTDPKRAIEMLSAEPYRLLITDISMPDMTGPELAREAFRIRPDVKVLFISGGFEQGVRFRWSDPQLDKPFTPTNFSTRSARSSRAAWGRKILPGEPSPRLCGMVGSAAL